MLNHYQVTFQDELPDFNLVMKMLVKNTGLVFSFREWLFHFDCHCNRSSVMPFVSYQEAYKAFLCDRKEDYKFIESNISCDELGLNENCIEGDVFIDKEKQSVGMYRLLPEADYLLVNILHVLKSLGGDFQWHCMVPPHWAGNLWNKEDNSSGIYRKW